MVPEDPPDGPVKVIASVDERDPWRRATEGLWAERLSADRYKLWNVPWHARGLNWGDVVRCEQRGEGHDERLPKSPRSCHRRCSPLCPATKTTRRSGGPPEIKSPIGTCSRLLG